jgi:type I restriction enzyme S subunit
MTGLPKGWTAATFGDLFDFKGGSQPPKSEFFPELVVGRIRLLQIRDFGSDDKAVYINDAPKWPKCSEKDIMVGRYGASVGKILTGKAGAYNVALIRWIFDESNLEREWVRRLLQSDIFQQPLQKVSRSAQNGFNKEDVAGIPLALPPLPEQRRIVRKLDALTARTTTARTHLTAIAKLVERYKLALYQSVFLTRQNQVELGMIAKVGTGATPKKGVARFYENAIVPWITSGAVNSKWVTKPSGYITDAAIQETNCKVFPAGSLLMAMYGEGKTRGQVARLEIAAATNQALAVIHEIDASKVDQEYLFGFLDSIYLEIRDEAEGGVQPNLSLGKVKAFKLPLPPLDEQREIVSRIETAFAKIDRLAAEAAKALKLVGHLDQRILAKAFAGDLVPQDPSDEPAETLLARIREARANAPKAKRGRKACARQETP